MEAEDNFFRISISMKNIWSLQYERFIIDGEEWEATGVINKRINKKLILGLQISYKLQSGGIFDSIIEAFHRSTNTTQQHREKFPKNKIQISYEPYGYLYQLYDDTFFTKEIRRRYPREYPRNPLQPPPLLPLETISLYDGSYFKFNEMIFPLEIIARKAFDYANFDNPKLYIQNLLFKNNNYKISLGIRTKIPFVNQSDYFYFSGWDVAMFFSNSFLYKKNLEFLSGISYTLFELKKLNWIRMPNHQWSFRFQINYYKKLIYFSEYVYISKTILNLGRLSEDSHYLTFGIKKYFSNSILTVSFTENFYLYATSPDVGVYLSYQIFANLF